MCGMRYALMNWYYRCTALQIGSHTSSNGLFHFFDHELNELPSCFVDPFLRISALCDVQAVYGCSTLFRCGGIRSAQTFIYELNRIERAVQHEIDKYLVFT